MALNENIKKGAYYRHCTGFDPEGNPVYTRVSFWTDSSDVKFEDGTKLDTAFAQISNSVDTLEGTTITGTLLAGEDTLVLLDTHIKTDNSVKYRYYTSKYGNAPSDVSLEEGKMTLSFRTLDENLLVLVEILEV